MTLHESKNFGSTAQPQQQAGRCAGCVYVRAWIFGVCLCLLCCFCVSRAHASCARGCSLSLSLSLCFCSLALEKLSCESIRAWMHCLLFSYVTLRPRTQQSNAGRCVALACGVGGIASMLLCEHEGGWRTAAAAAGI